MLCIMLERENMAANHKRIYRLYTEEGLKVRRHALTVFQAVFPERFTGSARAVLLEMGRAFALALGLRNRKCRSSRAT